jgi:hypothetical protein
VFTNQGCQRHLLLPATVRTAIKLEFAALLRANRAVEKINLYRATFAKLITTRHKKQFFLVGRRHRQSARKLRVRNQHSLLRKAVCNPKSKKRARRLLFSVARKYWARKFRGRLRMVKRRKQVIQKLFKHCLSKVILRGEEEKREQAAVRARGQRVLHVTKHDNGQKQKRTLQDAK